MWIPDSEGIGWRVRETRAAVQQLVVPMLRPFAYELVSNGQPRWWNAVCSVRNDLFMADSERGI